MRARIRTADELAAQGYQLRFNNPALRDYLVQVNREIPEQEGGGVFDIPFDAFERLGQTFNFNTEDRIWFSDGDWTWHISALEFIRPERVTNIIIKTREELLESGWTPGQDPDNGRYEDMLFHPLENIAIDEYRAKDLGTQIETEFKRDLRNGGNGTYYLDFKTDMAWPLSAVKDIVFEKVCECSWGRHPIYCRCA